MQLQLNTKLIEATPQNPRPMNGVSELVSGTSQLLSDLDRLLNRNRDELETDSLYLRFSASSASREKEALYLRNLMQIIAQADRKMSELNSIKSLVPCDDSEKLEILHKSLSKKGEAYLRNYVLASAMFEVKDLVVKISKAVNAGDFTAEDVALMFDCYTAVTVMQNFSKSCTGSSLCSEELKKLKKEIESYLSVEKAFTTTEKEKAEKFLGKFGDSLINGDARKTIPINKLFELASVLQQKGYISYQTLGRLEDLKEQPYSENNHKEFIVELLYPYFNAQLAAITNLVRDPDRQMELMGLTSGEESEARLLLGLLTHAITPTEIDRNLGKFNTNTPIPFDSKIRQWTAENKKYLWDLTLVSAGSLGMSKLITGIAAIGAGTFGLLPSILTIMLYGLSVSIGQRIEPYATPYIQSALDPLFAMSPSPTTESISAFKLKVEETEKEIKEIKRNPLREGSDTSKLQERIQRIAQTIREAENEFWGKEYGSASIIGTSEELMSVEEKKDYKERLTKMKEDFGISTDMPYISEEDLFKDDINERYEKLMKDITSPCLAQMYYPDYVKDYNTLVVEGWARQYEAGWDKTAWDKKIKELKQKLDEFKEKAYSSAAGMSFVS